MSKRKKTPNTAAMLELWRPPQDAGEAVGCLASTYTFAPELFDEQCLARFLEIESEPDREDLAFLLERESRLGGVYAGVLVDHTQAGVAHSLRWDVLPVRIPRGKQHAKIGLLVWHRHVRIIVASANLTEAGYRTNYEVAGAVELTPEDADTESLAAAVDFLRALVRLVPGASERLPAVQRAEGFLAEVERRVEGWKKRRRGERIRQHLVFTLPAVDDGGPARSSLDSAVQECRRRGGSPNEAWIASPFFDSDEPTSRVASSLCKLMARGGNRTVCFCVPAVSDAESAAVLRLAAPVALLRTPPLYQASVSIEMLPEADPDRNHRPWHAKMLALIAEQYSALMIGSSNFTSAGMGVGQNRNAEANLLTIVDRVAYGRDASRLEAVWPEMDAGRAAGDRSMAGRLGQTPRKRTRRPPPFRRDSLPPPIAPETSGESFCGSMRRDCRKTGISMHTAKASGNCCPQPIGAKAVVPRSSNSRGTPCIPRKNCACVGRIALRFCH
jgi:hypothetical protein